MLKSTDKQRLLETSVAVFLFLLVLGVYLSASKAEWSGDTLPASYLPISILEHGTLYLDYFPSLYDAAATKQYSDDAEGLPYYLVHNRGHYASGYSPWSAFLAVPVYAVPLAAGANPSRVHVLLWAKVAASIITALSVLFLFLAMRELVSITWASVIALVYALGTTAFSVTSQAMWEHGPSALFLTLGLFFLLKGRKKESAFPYAGLCFSIAVMMRYTDALIALAMALYILHTHRHILIRYLALSSVPAFLLLAYNHWYLGSAFQTGYFQLGSYIPSSQWTTPLPQGLADVLFSPSRGLFVYSPILLLSLFGLVWIWRHGPLFFRYLAAGMIVIIFVCSKWTVWWGGYCYGPRLLADIAPLLCAFLYPLDGFIRKRAILAMSFVLLFSVSFGMHAIGAYWYNARWDIQAQVSKNPSLLWSWKGSPFVYYGRYPYWDVGQFTRDLGIHKGIKAIINGIIRPSRSSRSKVELPSNRGLVSVTPLLVTCLCRAYPRERDTRFFYRHMALVRYGSAHQPHREVNAVS